jgi:hypothetical protein
MLSQRLLEEVKKITYLIYLNNLWLSIAQVRHLQYNRKRKQTGLSDRAGSSSGFGAM